MLKRMRAQFPRTHDNETNRARLHHICVLEFLMGSRAHMGQTAKGLEEEVSIRYMEVREVFLWVLDFGMAFSYVKCAQIVTLVCRI